MGDENEKRYVTLILKDTRYKVDTYQLSRRSRYFATLLSSDFRDHHLQEHIINYDIPISTFTNFVKWIETDDVMMIDIGRLLNKSMKIYCRKFDDILELLHLAVLFGVDELIEDIVDIIERFWLVIAENLIEIWLVAQDLCLKMLCNISLAACLDLFDQLSTEKLLQLTKHEFMQLVANNNVRSTKTSLAVIAAKWMDFNKELLPCVIHRKKLNMTHFLVSYNNVEYTNRTFHLSCWNGTRIFQYPICNYPKEFDKTPSLVGMQCVSRGYNLYFCGGEYGIGKGRFNKKIWRYSLLSKKWFIETQMPVARRHMIATFVKNKLLLVGGMGQFRIKLGSLDIFDVHTRTWSKGSHLPDNNSFTLIPEFCVFNGKLVIYMKDYMSLYIYCLNEDVWLVVKPNQLDDVLEINEKYDRSVYLLTYGDDTSFIHFDEDETKCATLTYITSTAQNWPESIVCETSTLKIRNCWNSPDGTDVLLFTQSGSNYIYVIANFETNSSRCNCILPINIYVSTIITPPLKNWLSRNILMFIPLLERYDTCTDLLQSKKLLKIMDPVYLDAMSDSNHCDECLKIDCIVPDHSAEGRSIIDTFLPKKIRRID